MVKIKSTKLSIPWSSEVYERYQRNAIIGNLHRSKRVTVNVVDQVKHIKIKFLKAFFRLRFVNIIRYFQSTIDVKD